TLVRANDGNFYGTTASGGDHSLGTVFRISPNGDFASLYSFDSGTSEGYSPSAGLVQASDGYLYGTAQFGGDNGLGAVFRMSLNRTPHGIYPFAFQGAEGFTPHGALVEGADGLYGTTHDGANACSCGAVFKLVPDAPTTSTTAASTSTTSTTHASSTTT